MKDVSPFSAEFESGLEDCQKARHPLKTVRCSHLPTLSQVLGLKLPTWSSHRQLVLIKPLLFPWTGKLQGLRVDPLCSMTVGILQLHDRTQAVDGSSAITINDFGDSKFPDCLGKTLPRALCSH